MSDVKSIVKFGAEDVGLEKTLKSVQTELGQLQTKVKSGDLSMSELESTMKRIGQVESLEKRLKGMGGEAAATAPKIDKLGDEAKTMGNKAEDAGDKGGIGLGKIGIAAGVAGAAFAAGMKVLELAADAARAVVDKFGEALDLGGELNDLSARTGETAGNLLVLQRAFDNSGVGADKVGTAVNKLQKFMDAASDSSSKQAELMGSLGISMADLEGKTPTEQMQIFAQKISGIQDPTERAATAMKVFGKSGGELLPLFADFSGELETAQGQLGSLPGVMDRSAAAFDAISDNLSVAKGKLTEFAAGMIEGAAPALEKFSAMLTGVDAAGWGQKLGEVVTRVADFLIGAFKSPMSIIELYGLQLNLNARTFGNLLLNGFITAGNFFKEFFSSQLPSLLIGQLTTSLMKGFADGLKFFVDNIGSVVTSFREYFGKAVESIASFFTETFNKIVGFFANDFQNAMSNPIDFISGKLNSALASATKNGSLVFKDEYDNASGSVIDRISQGLGAVSKTYANDLDQSTKNIGAEWDKVAGNLSISTQDFFGAEPAANRVADKFKEVEETGKKFREDFEASTENASKNTEAIPLHLQDAENSSQGINANLSGAGADLRGNTSQAKDNMKEIKTIGDLIAAQDAAKPMRSFKEESAAVRADLKALKEFIGEDLSKMSWPDIAKKMGIDRTKKEQKELFDEIKQRLEDIKNTEIDLKINGDASMEELDIIKQNIATIGLEDIVLTFDAPLSDIASNLADLTSTERELDLTADGALSQIASALPGYFENPLSLEFDADSSIQEVESSLNTLGSEPTELKLNASSGIENIRNELSKEIDLSLSSSEGSKILTTINSAVDAIKTAVLRLEQKLPQSALGY
jgi:hypothetical protein